jgi:hypothetical protein
VTPRLAGITTAALVVTTAGFRVVFSVVHYNRGANFPTKLTLVGTLFLRKKHPDEPHQTTLRDFRFKINIETNV